MALLWLPLDDPVIDAMSALARSPWEQADLDATWRLSGWPAPGGELPSKLVYERHEYAMDAGERRLSLQMSDWGGRITGFLLNFAVFYDPCGPDDPDLADLLRPQGVYAGWRTDADAGRVRFDTAWADGCERLENRLGVPQSSGRHFDRWQHATWRIGSRLLVVAQGEDFASYSLYDAAYLAVVDYPAGAVIPRGDLVYAALLRGYEDHDDR